MIIVRITENRFLCFFILFFLYFFNVLSRIIFSPLMPIICNDIMLAPNEVGNIFFILSTGFGFSLFLSQYISKIFSHKKTILISTFFSSCGLFILSLGTSLFSIKIGLLFLGISSGLFLPSSIALISRIFAKKYWGRLFGLYSAAQSMAFLVAPFLVEFILPYLYWKKILSSLGSISLFMTLIMLLFPNTQDEKGEAVNLQILHQLFKWPFFWFVLLLLALITGFNVGVFNMIPHYFASLSNQIITLKTNYLLIFTRSIGIFAALIGGWIMDLFGIRKSLAYGLIICSFFTCMMGIAPNFSNIAFLLQSLLAICLTPIIHVGVASLAPPGKNGMFVAIFSSFAFFLGSGVIPQMLGYMAKYEKYSLGFIILGIIGIFPGILLFWNKLPYSFSTKFEFIGYKKIEE